MTDTVAEVDSAEPEPESTPPQFKPRRVHLWLLIGVPAVVLVVLAGFGIWRAVTPGTETVKGAIEVGLSGMMGIGTGTDGNFNPGDACTAGNGYGDIASGAEVDVVDQAGKVLATGTLADGKAGPQGLSCAFLFAVPSVPMGQQLYGVRIGNANRGVVHFTAKQMQAGPVLAIGGE